MSATQSRLAEDIFYDLLTVEADKRAAALEAACAGDEALKAEVRSLLECHKESAVFLDTERVRGEAAGAPGASPLAIGTRVAGYTVQGLLGMGGMGVVYVAEQDRPRRTVALKLIRRGAATEGVLKRFAHEAEVLGRLQHPGIAQIYEAGTAELPEPTPFIAMELVQGLPLKEHADTRVLGVRERLELMALVCEAVDHAHQRGVIHRDLKPGNILVDGSGRPKVLDFGVARVLGSDLNLVTMQTGVGQLIGTLQYMSPEQVRANPEGVDGRADVYALGAVLFELLTGRTPHDLANRSIPDAARIICEMPAPRLGLIDRELRGDVETIVAKALDPEAARRYPSAAELAADLRRYLEGRPISARDDSALYVLRKQLRRYRGTLILAGASIVALAVVAGIALTQAGRNRELAASEAAAKTQALDALKIARDANAAADVAAARMRAELTTSSVERGRLLGRTGDLATAEDLIWPEFLKAPDSAQARWALFDLYAHQPSLGTFKAHDKGVWVMGFGRDGGRLYTFGNPGDPAASWDARTMEKAGALEGLAGGRASDVSTSTDGKVVAAVALDGTITVWDASTNRLRATIPGTGARCLSLDPTGDQVVAGSADGAMRIYDTRSGAMLKGLKAHKGFIAKVRWSPEGDWIASGGAADGSICIWDGSSSTATATFKDQLGGLNSLAVSPDSRVLASGADDRRIHLWDMKALREIGTLPGPSGPALHLAFGADGRTLMACGGWVADLWDLGSPVSVDQAKQRRIFSLRQSAFTNDMNPDGKTMAFAVGDGWVRTWDLTQPAVMRRLSGLSGRVEVAVSRDGRLAAVGDARGDVRIWDAATVGALARIRGNDHPVMAMVFSPDGALMATASADGVGALWDLATGARVAEWPALRAAMPRCLAFSPDGRMLAGISRAGEVELREVPSLKLARTVEGAADTLRFSPDGAMLVLMTHRGAVSLVRLDGAPAPTLPAEASGWQASFSADGSQLALASPARGVQVWNLGDGTLASLLTEQRALLNSAEFLVSDPGLLVTASIDGLLRVWDVAGRRPLIGLEGADPGETNSVAASADGRRLVTCGTSGAAAVWDLARFDRHIAGNLERQLSRMPADAVSPGRAIELRAWAAKILAGGDSPRAGLVSSEQIRAWGEATLGETEGR